MRQTPGTMRSVRAIPDCSDARRGRSRGDRPRTPVRQELAAGEARPRGGTGAQLRACFKVSSRPVRSSISFSRERFQLSQKVSTGTSEAARLVVGRLQVVVRNLRVQVMDVVQADVAGEELQPLRQLQEGAALQRRVGVAPLLRDSQ